MPQSPPDTPAMTMSFTTSGATVPPYFCGFVRHDDFPNRPACDAMQCNKVRVVGHHEHVIAENRYAAIRPE